MCGLLNLKHLGNLSDEFIVEQWSENAYYQYLFAMQEFTSCAPAPLLNTFVLKRIYRDQRFRNHPKNRKKALKADKKLRTIAGRLVRELKRNLGADSRYTGLIERFEAILSQRRNSRKKIYSIHEPEVQCISKGKEYKKYEFGNKVSIIRSATGLILGAQSFRNEYDGHFIETSLAQVERLTGRKIKILVGDRGYRGKKEINGTRILIPDTPQPSDSRYQKCKKHNLFCKRAGIEPTIGHLKSDYRLGRNFYKGLIGDAINILLVAVAYNFKRAMKALLHLLKIIIEKPWMDDSLLSMLFKGRLSSYSVRWLYDFYHVHTLWLGSKNSDRHFFGY